MKTAITTFRSLDGYWLHSGKGYAFFHTSRRPSEDQSDVEAIYNCDECWQSSQPSDSVRVNSEPLIFVDVWDDNGLFHGFAYAVTITVITCAMVWLIGSGLIPQAVAGLIEWLQS